MYHLLAGGFRETAGASQARSEAAGSFEPLLSLRKSNTSKKLVRWYQRDNSSLPSSTGVAETSAAEACVALKSNATRYRPRMSPLTNMALKRCAASRLSASPDLLSTV